MWKFYDLCGALFGGSLFGGFGGYRYPPRPRCLSFSNFLPDTIPKEHAMRINEYLRNIANSELTLPFFVVTIGESTFQPPIHRPAGVPDYQLLYTAEGRGLVRIRDEEFPVTEGQLYILPPFTPHEYRPDGEVWRTLWMTFNGTAVRSCFDFPADIRDGMGFPETYLRILPHRNRPNWRRQTSADLYSLLLALIDRPGLTAPREAPSTHSIAAAIGYISEHYAETVELSHLAALTGISPGHFCRLFKEYTHMRPIEYITHLRIETAKSLLLDFPSLPVYKIALRVGYTAPSYFSSLFRTAEGLSPEEYRAKMGVKG